MIAHGLRARKDDALLSRAAGTAVANDRPTRRRPVAREMVAKQTFALSFLLNPDEIEMTHGPQACYTQPGRTPSYWISE